MQMVPFFPSLRPRVVNRLWLESSYVNEEVQTARYEREHQSWRDSIKNTASDIQPLGKVLTIPGIETDDEDGNDDSEDSDSHDDEDTNDRGPPEFYSVADDTHPNEDAQAP